MRLIPFLETTQCRHSGMGMGHQNKQTSVRPMHEENGGRTETSLGSDCGEPNKVDD